MDNCEHVVDGCARMVTDLLERCSGLRVLAPALHTAGGIRLALKNWRAARELFATCLRMVPLGYTAIWANLFGQGGGTGNSAPAASVDQLAQQPQTPAPAPEEQHVQPQPTVEQPQPAVEQPQPVVEQPQPVEYQQPMDQSLSSGGDYSGGYYS